MEDEVAVVALSRRVAVVIDRGMVTKTSQVIWEHEIPLLEEIHGPEKVTIVTDKVAADADAGYRADPKDPHRLKPSEALGLADVFNGDAETEYNRLSTVYGMHPKQEMPIVEVVYGRYSSGAFKRLLGKPAFADLSNRQLRALLANAEVEFDPQARREALLKLCKEKLK